jgi:hypothetical protein
MNLILRLVVFAGALRAIHRATEHGSVALKTFGREKCRTANCGSSQGPGSQLDAMAPDIRTECLKRAREQAPQFPQTRRDPIRTRLRIAKSSAG